VAHDDALAVAGDDEHVVGFGPDRPALRVEGLEVRCGAAGELLDLALPERLAAAPLDRRDGVLEGAPRGLQRRQPAQAVGVALGREVQQRVGGMQAGSATGAVGQTLHRHFAKDAVKRPLTAAVDQPTAGTLGVGDGLDPLLAAGPHIEMVLQQRTQELAAVDLEPGFQLGVRERRGRLALQEPGERLKAGTGALEMISHGDLYRGDHRRGPRCEGACTSRKPATCA